MKRILIIEDDEALAEELSILLKRNGYLPVYSEPCDLVLMDVNLPEENGFARCRKIKEKSSVPVICAVPVFRFTTFQVTAAACPASRSTSLTESVYAVSGSSSSAAIQKVSAPSAARR